MGAPRDSSAEPADPARDPDRVDPAVWRTAFSIIVGALAVAFDTTIVTVALGDLARELHALLSTIQWVSTAYLLAMFVTIPLAGWAQSRMGGKFLWITALAVFLLGSVLCAMAWNALSLIVFRVVQGVGGGIMMPLMATLVIQAARGRNIGKVMATVTLPTALGPILGPVLGGVILSLANWRWIFLSTFLSVSSEAGLPGATSARIAPHAGYTVGGWTSSACSCCPLASPPSSTGCHGSGATWASPALRCSYR